jgi:hypothetical protein
MMMLRRISRMTAVALVAVAVATPAMAGQLIVRSTGPSAKQFPPGKQLPDSAKIDLRPGDSITLLGPASTRTLRGPGSFLANGGGDVQLAANRRARFGALRSGDLNLNPSPWNIDVSQGGKICVPDPAKLTLWRPNASDAVKLNIIGNGGSSTSVEWAAGRATLAWPSQLPIRDGAEYQLQFGDGGETSKVTLATMPGIPAEMMDTAQALIERGCETQVDILINGIDKGTR